MHISVHVFFSRLQPTLDEALKPNAHLPERAALLEQPVTDLEQSTTLQRPVTVNLRPAPKSQPSARQALSFQVEDSEKARLANLQPQTDVSSGQARPRFVVAPTCGALARVPCRQQLGGPRCVFCVWPAAERWTRSAARREVHGPARRQSQARRPTSRARSDDGMPLPGASLTPPHRAEQSRAERRTASALRCRAVQCSALAVQCSAVQCGAIMAVQCIAEQL